MARVTRSRLLRAGEGTRPSRHTPGHPPTTSRRVGVSALGRPWGPSAIADQKTGGAIAWGISELPMLAIAIALALAWTRDDERTARRLDRAAERDGDAELVEYNAMLARMRDRSER